jgi:hypothetical protein
MCLSGKVFRRLGEGDGVAALFAARFVDFAARLP